MQYVEQRQIIEEMYKIEPDSNQLESDKRISKSKYTKTFKVNHKMEIINVDIDVYDVLKLWDVRNPALQHLIKKALQAGDRGHKDTETDLQDIIDSAVRAKELECLT